MIYIDGQNYLNLPEQVQQNYQEIQDLKDSQTSDHNAINTNTNNISDLTTRVVSVESTTLKGDEEANKVYLYRSNKADMGSVQFKTFNGYSIVGEGDVAVEITSDCVKISGDQTIEGVKTFKDPIHGNQLANENGGAIVRYKDTENITVLGGVGSHATIMGSETRPTYSKDGSDFTGVELALKSDVDDKINFDEINVDVIHDQEGHDVFTHDTTNSYFGNTDLVTTIQGNSDRPIYKTNDNEVELALSSDVEAVLPDNPTDDGSYVLGNTVASGTSEHTWNSTEDVDFVSLPAVDTSTDGTYVLKATVASGAVTYSWIKE